MSPQREAVWKVATAVLAASTLTLAISMLGGDDEAPAGVLRYELRLPVEVGANSDFGSNIAISPDGRRIAYSGMAEGAESPGLWVRDRDRLEPVELSGTELGVHPTFSPDGSQVAFIGDDRSLKVVSLTGRPPVTLHEGVRRGGLSWGDDGNIYFSQWVDNDFPAPLHRIPATGGEVELVTAVDSSRSEIAHYFPDVLPGSELVLFIAMRDTEYDAETRDVAVANIATGHVTILLEGIQAVWSNTGHILAVRGDGALVSATLDVETLEVGPTVPVFEGVQIESLVSADLTMSDNGTLVYVPGASLGEMGRTAVWVDRDGVRTPVDDSWSGLIFDPRLSPDGSRVAVGRSDGVRHVWVKELDAGPESKLTFEGRVNERPVWTPDGAEVAYVSNRAQNRDIYRRRADAATPDEGVLDVEGEVQELEFSRDGEWMVVRVGGDIYAKRTELDSELIPIIADPSVAETSFALSPDGRWIAYASDESSARMVYVRPFPNANEGKWPVSIGSATSPRWAPDGSELYYRRMDGQFMAAEVVSGPTFLLGERTPLFSFGGLFTNNAHAQYDVHPDGDRFLMIQLSNASLLSDVVVVENFVEELERSSPN